MGGDAGDTLQHLAGYGVGALSALTSIKGGGLQNFFLNRQRAIEDPAFRASLVGSPFTSGMFFQGGSDVPAGPAGSMPVAGSVAAPSDVAWLQQQNPARRYVPDLPPLPAATQVQVQAAQGIVSGLQSADPVVRAQAKLIGKIPLTLQEQDAAVGRGKAIQGTLGPGGTVGVESPGMPITIGSPYSVSPGVGLDEFPTYDQALAAARLRGSDWTVEQTQRGTFRPVQITPPATPAPPVAQGSQPAAPAAQPATPPATPPARAPTQPAAPPPRRQAAPAPPAPPLNLTAGIPQPPQAPAYAGGPWSPEPAPSLRAPRVGYPSGAFDDTGATTAPAGAPPELLAAPPAPAAAAPVPAAVTPWAPAAPPARARGGGGALEPQAFVQGMVNRGWSVPEASAAAGNVHVESGFRPGIVAPNGDTGLLQWNGPRLDGMQRYAAATGRDWRDPEAQMDWIAMERSGDSKRFGVDERGGYRKAFASGGAPGDMAGQFGRYVERPADLSATVAQRSAMAAAYGGGGGVPTRAVAAMPAPAPAVAPPGMFARVFAPASAEAAEVPPGAVVAYPSPAPQEGAAAAPTPDLVPPGTPQAPPQRVPPPPPPPPGGSAPPLEPQTKGVGNVPLARISVHGADGSSYEYDYGSPSDFVRQMKQAQITSLETATPAQLRDLQQIQQQDYERRLTTDANVTRYLRPQTEEEKRADSVLQGQREALDRLYRDFPNPGDRDKYVNWFTTRFGYDLVQLVHNNPDFGRFVEDLKPFNKFNEIQHALPDYMQTNLAPYVPTGGERYARDFEQHLFDYTNAVDTEQLRRNAANRMPAGEVTPEWAAGVRQRVAAEAMRRATPELIEAMGLPARVTGQSPPRATAPVAPAAPGADVPLVTYGHSLGG